MVDLLRIFLLFLRGNSAPFRVEAAREEHIASRRDFGKLPTHSHFLGFDDDDGDAEAVTHSLGTCLQRWDSRREIGAMERF